jgi:hypothetical protein
MNVHISVDNLILLFVFRYLYFQVADLPYMRTFSLQMFMFPLSTNKTCIVSLWLGMITFIFSLVFHLRTHRQDICLHSNPQKCYILLFISISRNVYLFLCFCPLFEEVSLFQDVLE